LPTFKLTVSDPETGKAQTVEVKDPQAQALLGLRIGEVIDGSLIGLKGKLKITGGSDRAGFPMRPDVHGGVKKYVLLASGPGFHPRRPGERRRKLVRGNVITEEIYQVNAVLVK
jgi:small subunit ribosomal protein S6e